jgi:NAD(P)-dependent dehydrogenase (short-subunit alcohol dehydrogenase family)
MQGKVVVVTGGFGSLGRAVAEAARAAGATVARLDLAPAPAGAAKTDFGGVDISDPAAAAKAVAAIAQQCGGLDVLVNVAGGFVWETLSDGGPATWEKMYAMNVKTTVTMTKAALPELLKRPDARIINIGALASYGRTAAGMGSYAASKAAVARLTESLAEELKDKDITVNAVLPSIIDTPVNRADMPTANFAEWVAPRDLAAAILLLASPAARAITGALIPVTRGPAA